MKNKPKDTWKLTKNCVKVIILNLKSENHLKNILMLNESASN